MLRPSVGRRASAAAPIISADANRPVASGAPAGRTSASCVTAGRIGPGLSGRRETLRAERVGMGLAYR